MSARGIGLFATRIDETFRDLLRTSVGSGLNLLRGGLSDDYEDEVDTAVDMVYFVLRYTALISYACMHACLCARMHVYMLALPAPMQEQL
jgi:hypothetical protein